MDQNSYIELVRRVMPSPKIESLRMSESPRSTILPLSEVLPASSGLLPDGHGVPGPEVALDLLLPQPPVQQLGSLHIAIHESPTPELVNGHVPRAPLLEPDVLVSHPVPHSRSPSPVNYEEEDDHFLRRWQQWNEHERRWLPKSRISHPPAISRDVSNYFCLYVRSGSTRKGDNSSLVFGDFTAVLDSLLRTIFVDDVDQDIPIEYPIHCLFQKRGVLQSKLEDAREILGAEQTPEDLTSKAEVFGFDGSPECDTATHYLTNLVIHLGKLLEVVEAECKQKAKQLEESLANNQISFDLLEYYYEEGAMYAANIGAQYNDLGTERRIVLVALKKVRFRNDNSFPRGIDAFQEREDKLVLSFEAEYLEWDGVRLQTRKDLNFEQEYPWDHDPYSNNLKRARIFTQEAYQGTRPISSLFLQRMTEETLVELTERGRLYLSYCRVFHAEYYSDTKTQNEFSKSDNNVKPCVRRVMIDPFGFHHASQGYNPNLRIPLPDVAEEDIARFPYWIGGYDLDTHEWQAFRIWDLKPIEYDQEAWKNLIMDENIKDFIRALVDSTCRSPDTSHPVQLKKGKNVLLSGSPGTGRTTAVHAVCNLLKRPLLTIYARDLPSSFDRDLSSKLAQLVSLAVMWNAVIVVKAADSFLKLSYNMDHVNAIISQFESHDCIAFWVTSDCDKELLSSFYAVIDFPELNTAARRQLWLDHFGKVEPAGSIPKSERTLASSPFGWYPERIDYSVHPRDIEKLSRYQLNGRMIKNIVRSARVLADSNGEHISIHHVKVVMKAQRLEKPTLWRKVTRVLMPPAKLRTLVQLIKHWMAL